MESPSHLALNVAWLLFSWFLSFIFYQGQDEASDDYAGPVFGIQVDCHLWRRLSLISKCLLGFNSKAVYRLHFQDSLKGHFSPWLPCLLIRDTAALEASLPRFGAGSSYGLQQPLAAAPLPRLAGQQHWPPRLPTWLTGSLMPLSSPFLTLESSGAAPKSTVTTGAFCPLGHIGC